MPGGHFSRLFVVFKTTSLLALIKSSSLPPCLLCEPHGFVGILDPGPASQTSGCVPDGSHCLLHVADCGEGWKNDFRAISFFCKLSGAFSLTLTCISFRTSRRTNIVFRLGQSCIFYNLLIGIDLIENH